MYQRILLAYDGTLEGRAALREGALIARRYDAEVHLLSVIAESSGLRVADAVSSGSLPLVEERYRAILEEGAERLRAIGFVPHATLASGEPAKVIGAVARKTAADLVVVGHRKQSMLERWWSGSSGAYLMDNIDCTLLISRKVMSEAEFQAELAAIAARAGGAGGAD